jgi:hypothetical protein
METVRDVKCFVTDGKMQVALFGSPSEQPDGWLRNDQWEQVFRTYPNLLPLDQRLSLQEAQALVPFVDGFIDDVESSDELLSVEQVFVSEPESASPSNENISPTSFLDLVQDLSDACGFENKVVKRVAKALASEIQERIDAGDSFKIGEYSFRVRPLSGDGKRSCRVSRT